MATTPIGCGRSFSSTSTCRSGRDSASLPGECSASAISASFNDLMLVGTLSGVEMGLSLAGVPHKRGRRAGGHAVADGVGSRKLRQRRLAR